MDQKGSESSGTPGRSGSGVKERRNIVLGFWGVRYQVKDVARSVAFYTQQLGLEVDQQRLPAFAQLSVGGLKLILSGPGASGSRPMPGGGHQEPGGWNRVILQVADLACADRGTETGRTPFSQRDGGRPGRQADPTGRSRRQSNRVVRAGSISRT